MVEIRALNAGDRPQWDALWHGYVRFYRQRLPDDVTDATFNRLVGGTGRLHGLAAADGPKLVGFVHYLFHPSSWTRAEVCYLEDLFVDPAVRGRGVGRSLIQAVYAAADLAKAATVYWMTQEFNADGRALYDTLARRTSFIRYER